MSVWRKGCSLRAEKSGEERAVGVEGRTREGGRGKNEGREQRENRGRERRGEWTGEGRTESTGLFQRPRANVQRLVR